MMLMSCSLSDKDTKLKANHNGIQVFQFKACAVPYRTKILN